MVYSSNYPSSNSFTPIRSFTPSLYEESRYRKKKGVSSCVLVLLVVVIIALITRLKKAYDTYLIRRSCRYGIEGMASNFSDNERIKNNNEGGSPPVAFAPVGNQRGYIYAPPAVIDEDDNKERMNVNSNVLDTNMKDGEVNNLSTVTDTISPLTETYNPPSKQQNENVNENVSDKGVLKYLNNQESFNAEDMLPGKIKKDPWGYNELSQNIPINRLLNIESQHREPVHSTMSKTHDIRGNIYIPKIDTPWHRSSINPQDRFTRGLCDTHELGWDQNDNP